MAATLYVSDFPELLQQWDWEANGDLNPEKVTYKNNRKVWWVCSKGHKWDAVVSARTNGSGCPYCSGRRAISGVNDLATLYPDVAKQWDEVKNKGIDISSVSPGSHKSVWWICDKGHSWKAVVKSRTKGNSCPYCAGKKAIPGVNDLATLRPDLVAQWDYSKNEGIQPKDVLCGYRKKVWWTCEKGHEWEAAIRYRCDGTGCPYCTGQKADRGVNDLATLRPDLAAQWDNEKNSISPSDVICGSGEKVWWVCEKGHSWEAVVKKRTIGQGCPYCSNRRVLAGFNDLATLHPHLVDQWDVAKNKNISPYEMTPGSDVAAWWTCEKGHSWKSLVKDRTRGIGCPHCISHISQAEQEIYNTVVSLVEGDAVVQSDRSIIGGKELDIYVPDKHIAIEYNGLYWHSEACGRGKNYHYDKWKMCRDNGIQLITIWEDEWRDKQEIVKSMLAHKLGASQSKRIYARNTTITPLESPVARQFLDTYHIQGSCSSSAYFGLYDNFGEIVGSVLLEKDRKHSLPGALRYIMHCCWRNGKDAQIRKTLC